MNQSSNCNNSYFVICEYIYTSTKHFKSDMVPPNKKLFGGTVPPNKKLFGGTVPPNKKIFGGTVPPNKKLFGGTVPPNNFFLNKKVIYIKVHYMVRIRLY